MSIIKSFSVGNGDMFYILHGSDSFTIIDCCLNDDKKDTIVNEIIEQKSGKTIHRFISTHPDQDHIRGLKYLDEKISIVNFYCVENAAIKTDATEDFKHYCRLRDGEKAYYVYKDCKRKWINDSDKKRHGAGIDFLWPIPSNADYQEALKAVSEGTGYNDISTVFTYSLNNGITVMWMGDLEESMLEKIKDLIQWPQIDVLFAPHHGRKTGKVSSDVLKKMEPSLVIIGEAPSDDLDYYSGYHTITQNTAKDIVFDCSAGKAHIFVLNENYSFDISFLTDEGITNAKYGTYLGTLYTKKGN